MNRPAAPNDQTPDDQRVKAFVRARLFGRPEDEVRVGRFVVIRRIGEGGMGVVYAAYDPKLDRKIAIKLLHADASAAAPEQASARLMREAQALARVSHPNVVQIYEVGTHDGDVYVAMEFIEGVTLAEWLSRPRSWREVVEVFVAAGRGLAAAHAKKLVHRDFKPANVLVAKDGQVRVLDFGLARRVRGTAAPTAPTLDGPSSRRRAGPLDMTLTSAGVRMGTPAYMAPEQHEGQGVDARTDQFSFCVALYEALFGQRPFAGDDIASLAQSVTQGDLRAPPRGTKVPEWIRRVVERGLAVLPEGRWPSMDALLEQLGRDPGARRRRVWGIGAAAAVFIGAWVAGNATGFDDPAACEGARDHLVGVWDEARKRTTRDAMLATRADIADSTWARVEQLLDDYAGAWTDQHTEACVAHRKSEQSDELFDRRMRCLDDRLEALRARVDVLAAADESVVERAVSSVADLPPLATCEDPAALEPRVRPPDDPETAAVVAQIRTSLARVSALAGGGKYDDALTIAARAVAEARNLEYPPALAEALLARAEVELALERNPDAIETLGDAYWTATAARHDEVAASAWVRVKCSLHCRSTTTPTTRMSYSPKEMAPSTRHWCGPPRGGRWRPSWAT